MSGPYEDIIHLSRPKSKFAKMSREKRGAQFAPFSALTGYEEAIEESSRYLEQKPLLDEQTIEILNNRILEAMDQELEITLTYFEKDKHRRGGLIKSITDKIKKFDEIEKILTTQNGLKIYIDDVLDVK